LEHRGGAPQYFTSSRSVCHCTQRYCGVDALCVVHLLHSLQRIIEMRQFASLMRVSIKDLCRCGQQHIVMSKLREAYHVLGYVYNAFEPQVRSFDGATVLDPLPDFYIDPVATLDFASLYPSIMVGNNICPSTYIFPALAKEYGVPYTRAEAEAEAEASAQAPSAKPSANVLRVQILTVVVDDDHMPSFVQRVQGEAALARNFGVVSYILEEMLAARKAVKKLMGSATGLAYQIYNMRQLALKVACNST